MIGGLVLIVLLFHMLIMPLDLLVFKIFDKVQALM